MPAFSCGSREEVVVADQDAEGSADERQERREHKHARNAELSEDGSHDGISRLRLR